MRARRAALGKLVRAAPLTNRLAVPQTYDEELTAAEGNVLDVEGVQEVRVTRIKQQRVLAKSSGVSGYNLVDDGEGMTARNADGSLTVSVAMMAESTPTSLGSFGDASGGGRE